jgi:TrmH family RNA methyltransferase
VEHDRAPALSGASALTNVASERVRRVRRLAKRSARSETGRLLVEGPQACREAALAGLVVDLYLTADAAHAHPEIAAATDESGGHIHEASAEYVRAISTDAQGFVAVAGDPWSGWTVARSLDRLVRLAAVFEQIRDPGNAGTAIRSADAAGADLVVFADQSVDPAAPKVVRSSAGSYFHLPVVRAGMIEEAVAPLRRAGLEVLAADGAADLALGAAVLERPAVWLFGNEVRGLSAAALAAADRSIRIEIHGRAESLNVAMAATLCLYASIGQLRAD